MKAAIIDPTCTTCHGRGFVIGGDDEQPCPGCNLSAREAERTSTTRYCDACHRDRPITGMTFARGEFGNTYATCGSCAEAIAVAHEASVEAMYREAYDGLSPLEQRYADGDR